MRTYTTLSGEVLDLSHLPEEEGAYFYHCYAAYRQGMAWVEFSNNLVYGPANPLLQATGGVVTKAVWEHVLFRALHDLDDRLAIRQRFMAVAPGDNLDADPVADEWIRVREAETRKGVTHNALHYAIRQGQVIAHPARPGGSWLLVSVRSLERWQPSRVRQQAGRTRRRRSSVT